MDRSYENCVNNNICNRLYCDELNKVLAPMKHISEFECHVTITEFATGKEEKDSE